MTIPEGPTGRYLRTQEAAKILGLSRRTLEKHRSYGTGPQFLKLGGRVVYKIEDLHSWALRGIRKSMRGDNQDERAASIRMRMRWVRTDGVRA